VLPRYRPGLSRLGRFPPGELPPLVLLSLLLPAHQANRFGTEIGASGEWRDRTSFSRHSPLVPRPSPPPRHQAAWRAGEGKSSSKAVAGFRASKRRPREIPGFSIQKKVREANPKVPPSKA